MAPRERAPCNEPRTSFEGQHAPSFLCSLFKRARVRPVSRCSGGSFTTCWWIPPQISIVWVSSSITALTLPSVGHYFFSSLLFFFFHPSHSSLCVCVRVVLYYPVCDVTLRYLDCLVRSTYRLGE